MNRLRAGIIGMKGVGAQVLAALEGSDLFEPAALADPDRELLEDYGRQYELPAYDDNRSLIVGEKLDVVFLTLPTHLCGECIRLAAQRGIHIFKEAPLARTLPEAIEWVKLANKSGVKFHVGAQRRFAPGYLGAHQLVRAGRIGEVYLVRAENFVGPPADWSWRGDPILAGGGVLLEEGYEMIDQMVWDLGPPEQLYSLNTDMCHKRVLPPYRTEDTVVLTLKFGNGAMGSLLTSWMTGPAPQRLLLHGTQGSIEAQTNLLRIFNVDGQVTAQEKYNVDEGWLISQQIRHFADGLLSTEVRPVSTAEEHLANVAVIESAYLSARTQLPETLKVFGSLFEVK